MTTTANTQKDPSGWLHRDKTRLCRWSSSLVKKSEENPNPLRLENIPFNLKPNKLLHSSRTSGRGSWSTHSSSSSTNTAQNLYSILKRSQLTPCRICMYPGICLIIVWKETNWINFNYIYRSRQVIFTNWILLQFFKSR